jgi:hypothetical protein
MLTDRDMENVKILVEVKQQVWDSTPIEGAAPLQVSLECVIRRLFFSVPAVALQPGGPT